MSESRQRVKLELEATNPFSLVDKLTGLPVVIPRGVDLQFELLRLFAGALVDISNYNSITIEVQAFRSTTAANLMTKTLAFGSFTLEPDLVDWQADVEGAASQHAIISFTNQESNLDLDEQPTKDFWLVIYALTKDSPTRRITLGCSLITFAEDGSPLDAEGPVQGNNLIPGGATYDGAGLYTLTGLTAGKVYSVTKGVNDTSYDNGGGPITVDGNAVAAGTSFDLIGTPSALVTFIIRKADYLTQDESDARYTLAGDEAAQDAAIVAAQSAADDAQVDATQALADAADARSEYHTAASQAAMLALSTADKGDVCERTDTGRWYWLSTTSYGTLADWKILPLGMEYLGQWAVGTTYAINKFVARTGSIYLSIQGANTGHLPEEEASTWWTLFMAAGSLQLTDTLPEAEEVDDAGQVGTSTEAARGDHRHPTPDVSTQSAAGFESAADKKRFDFSEIGGPNAGITKILHASDGWNYIFGPFTTWDNVPAPGIAKVDSHGHVDPLFDAGTGPSGSIYFASETSDGGIVFASNAKTTFDGGSSQWLHKIDSTGAVFAGFTSPSVIAATGTDALLGLCALDGFIVAVSWQTLRQMDNDGVTTAYANGEINLHNVASEGPTGDRVVLTSQRDAAYDGIEISASVKLIDMSGATIDQDATWLAGATEGGDFDADRTIWAPDGSFFITATNIYYTAGSFAWNSGAEDAKGLIKLLPDGTQDHTFAPIIVRTSAPVFCYPLAIDSLGRVYFTGDIVSINGTAVTANRLYRVDADGSNEVEFTGFNASISGVVVGTTDALLMITGSFTAYGELPVPGFLFMDDDGNRIYSHDAAAGGGGVGDDYDYIYIDAGAMVSRTNSGAEASTTEKATNYIDSDVYLFDGATQEYVQFKFAFPDWWNLGTIKAKFFWEPASGASPGDGVVWGIRAGARSNDDAIDVALGTEVEAADVVLAVGDLHVSPVVSMTVGGSPALGDLVWFQITRVVGSGSDNMTEDAHLLGVQFQFKKLTTPTELW